MSGSLMAMHAQAHIISAGTGDGSSAANAGYSALAIKQRTGTTTDGLYWVKPLGGTAIQVYCDMNTDGGGWMLIARTHPGGTASAGTWGWHGGALGGVSTFTAAYQMGWYTNFHAYGSIFSEIIYGNRANLNTNAWGPFIYKQSTADYVTFMTSDTQQSWANRAVLKSDLAIYNSSTPPGMQTACGFAATGTANNNYYMRDCCGFSATYGVHAFGLTTTYIGDTTFWTTSGPFCILTDAVDGSNNFIQTGADNHTGGTRQVMIMVR